MSQVKPHVRISKTALVSDNQVIKRCQNLRIWRRRLSSAPTGCERSCPEFSLFAEAAAKKDDSNKMAATVISSIVPIVR